MSIIDDTNTKSMKHISELSILTKRLNETIDEIKEHIDADFRSNINNPLVIIELIKPYLEHDPILLNNVINVIFKHKPIDFSKDIPPPNIFKFRRKNNKNQT